MIYTQEKNAKSTARILTNPRVKVQEWIKNNCLNTQKSVCVMFSKKAMTRNTEKPDCIASTKQSMMQSRSFVYLKGEELELVTQFKCLGVILDPNLTLKKKKKTYQKGY